MDPFASRRSFLYKNLTGVGGIALVELLGKDLFGSPRPEENPLAPKRPHHAVSGRPPISRRSSLNPGSSPQARSSSANTVSAGWTFPSCSLIFQLAWTISLSYGPCRRITAITLPLYSR